MRTFHGFHLICLVVSALLLVSCRKDDTTAPTMPGPTLTPGQSSFTLRQGDSASTTISGGTLPYSLLVKGDTTRVTAMLAGTVLTVHALSAGSSSLLIGDNSSPRLTVGINVTVSIPPLVANPPGVTIVGTSSQNVTISSGTHPYVILQQPNPGLASAHFVDPNLDAVVLTISGVSTASGSTAVIVRDASNPPRSVTVGISKIQ